MTHRTTLLGLSLATLIVSAWLGLTGAALFIVPWQTAWPVAPLVVALQCWLFVGLFILAHDAMHGTLAPGLPRLNRLIGCICVTVYAGFDYDHLRQSHHAHHRHSGTALDPDFDADHPAAFWPWYARFFRHYFGYRQFAVLAGASVLLALLLGPRAPLMLPFWALPAILSSLQLFAFGTFLPHRHHVQPFADAHRARSSGFSWPVSLLTCFHFGHHHTHHAMPHVPWWQLPAASRTQGETA